MKAVHKDDLSVTPIRQGPALWTILPALTYKVPPRHTEEHSEVVPLADCVLFAWRQDRLRRAYAQLDEGANPSEDLTRVVEYRVGEARHYLPDTDMHYAVALQRRGRHRAARPRAGRL